MNKFKCVLSDDQAILDMAADCELFFPVEDIESDLVLFARGIEQAVLAKLAEQEPVMYARTYYGEIDWDEVCVTEKMTGH